MAVTEAQARADGACFACVHPSKVRDEAGKVIFDGDEMGMEMLRVIVPLSRDLLADLEYDAAKVVTPKVEEAIRHAITQWRELRVEKPDSEEDFSL